MKVYLLRHGETAYNAQRRYLGRSDIPLSAKGRSALAQANIFPQTVYISPLCRAAETAEILFPEARLVPVPDLQEMDFGIFEGRTYLEMDGLLAYQEWIDGGCLGKIPGGESKADFCARVCRAFSTIMDQAVENSEETLVIAAHGGTQMAVMEHYALPRRNYFDWQSPPGGGFVLDASRWKGERVLELLQTVQYTKAEKT